MEAVSFIGIGAQKAGTSWMYACLYEHPELYMPVKEINFFSRERFITKGVDWYNSIFVNCPANKLCGEFSTSYLASELAPERIHNYNPQIKLILIVRDPVNRAYSNYINDIKSGSIPKNTPFEDALKIRSEYINNGLYGKHIKNYLKMFDRERILIVDYLDIKNKPKDVIETTYRFLNVNPDFLPWALNKNINPGNKPKFVFFDRFIAQIAHLITMLGLHRLRWFIKKSGLSDFLRSINSHEKSYDTDHVYDYEYIYNKYFKDDMILFKRITGINITNIFH